MGHWIVRKAEVVLNELLVFQVPETGYDTPKYLMFDDSIEEVRDFDENIVGILRIADPGERITISLDELSRLVADMRIGEIINFGCSESSSTWGVSIDSSCIVIGCHGSGNHQFYDLTHGSGTTDIASFLSLNLKDHTTGFIFYEIPKM
ncbi:hypothetical protein [Bacteroides cellulosilyticus]|uniref:hypothetical protein n=1 Tax=Bacteroides cellulosilyticus TaxID=246787 RepID=UPI003565BAF5